jgi:hypothetical protein
MHIKSGSTLCSYIYAFSSIGLHEGWGESGGGAGRESGKYQSDHQRRKKYHLSHIESFIFSLFLLSEVEGTLAGLRLCTSAPDTYVYVYPQNRKLIVIWRIFVVEKMHSGFN